MRVLITSGTIVKGIGDIRPGVRLDVDPKTARDLFVAGKAVPCEMVPEKPAVKTVKPATRKTKAKGKK